MNDYSYVVAFYVWTQSEKEIGLIVVGSETGPAMDIHRPWFGPETDELRGYTRCKTKHNYFGYNLLLEGVNIW